MARRLYEPGHVSATISWPSHLAAPTGAAGLLGMQHLGEQAIHQHLPELGRCPLNLAFRIYNAKERGYFPIIGTGRQGLRDVSSHLLISTTNSTF